MNPTAEFDLIVYGASGYTGRLVAEYLAQRYPNGGELRWAMAGRSAEKLTQVRDHIGAPADTPLIVAHADDPAQLDAMVRRARAIVTTVGPYQLYGDPLVAACVANDASSARRSPRRLGNSTTRSRTSRRLTATSDSKHRAASRPAGSPTARSGSA